MRCSCTRPAGLRGGAHPLPRRRRGARQSGLQQPCRSHVGAGWPRTSTSPWPPAPGAGADDGDPVGRSPTVSAGEARRGCRQEGCSGDGEGRVRARGSTGQVALLHNLRRNLGGGGGDGVTLEKGRPAGFGDPQPLRRGRGACGVGFLTGEPRQGQDRRRVGDDDPRRRRRRRAPIGDLTAARSTRPSPPIGAIGVGRFGGNRAPPRSATCSHRATEDEASSSSAAVRPASCARVRSRA